MRVLLIGATGFLGRHVLELLGGVEGTEVVTATRSPLPAGPARAPDPASEPSTVASRHVQLDLADGDTEHLAGIIGRIAPDAVVNCAGATTGDAEALAASHITGPAALVRAMALAAPGARLVQLGSAAEYGRVPTGVPIREDARTRPVGAYGVAKLAGTRIVEVARAVGLATVVLRVFNPVGPGAPATGLPGRIAEQVAKAVAGGDQVRLGPLDTARDFVDARDVARAVAAVLASPVLPAPVLNVGGGRAVSARELATLFAMAAGYHGGFLEEPDAGSPRSAQVPWQQADIRAIRDEVGWTPRIELPRSVWDHWRSLS